MGRGAAAFVEAPRDAAVLAGLGAEEGPRRPDRDFELVQNLRRFAEDKIRPEAEHVHRANPHIPEE